MKRALTLLLIAAIAVAVAYKGAVDWFGPYYDEPT